MSGDSKSFMLLLTHNVLNLQFSSSPYNNALLNNNFFSHNLMVIIDSWSSTSSLKPSSASLKLYGK